MSALHLLIITVLALCGVYSVPIVLKESTPNGESIIAISSSDPEIEKLFLNSYKSQRASPENSLLRSNFYNPGVQSFNLPTPERTITGTGRSFDETNPFIVPFLLTPNLDGFQFNNWFRNIENVYEADPSFSGEGEIRTVKAVNNNGHVYGKVETAHLDSKKP